MKAIKIIRLVLIFHAPDVLRELIQDSFERCDVDGAERSNAGRCRRLADFRRLNQLILIRILLGVCGFLVGLELCH